MSDENVVGNSGELTQPGETTGPQPDASGRVQQRIESLARERNQLQQTLESQNAELAAMREEFASLKGSISSPEPQEQDGVEWGRQNWNDLPDQKLYRQVVGDDPLKAAAMEELVERFVDKAVDAKKGEVMTETNFRDQSSHWARQTIENFGEAAADNSSELFAEARKVYAEEVTRATSLGKQHAEVLQKDPKFEYNCYQEAFRRLNNLSSSGLKERDSQIEELKQQLLMGGGVSNAARHSAEEAEALGRKTREGAREALRSKMGRLFAG